MEACFFLLIKSLQFILLFFNTSIYFEGEGGQTIGQLGHSKDHRPDLNQMVVGVVLDNHGHPVCCEMWPGNTVDVKSLIPVIERIRSRFKIGQYCIVTKPWPIWRKSKSLISWEPG